MRKLIRTTILSLVMSTAVLADGVVYHIFADGLSCQHCAMTIDQQLREIDGVERVDILPEKGIVNVRVADGHALEQQQVATVLADAGVTFRRMEQHPVGAGNQENSL